MLKKLAVITFIVLLSACASTSEKKSTLAITECPEQRSDMCTREYLPVCATRDTGIRCITAPCPSSEEKTYGNACTACADAKVSAYRSGACEQNDGKK
ncbi:MAG: hypothetical protein EOO68_26105 [Moraxellaceae bacterium]|nr:MAG: hypothetical protein EOO68_26105 [Moraxellaceae bacterium]